MSLLSLLYDLFILWFALDAFLVATTWFAISTIQPRFPGWWKTAVCDTVPTPPS